MIFFSLTILQLFSIHVTVLPCKSIWINFASKMLYGSEYIISLSHREKIYCNHAAFLLIISIRGSRGRENAQNSSPVWSFLSLLLFIALFSLPLSLSFFFFFSFMPFGACTNAENDGPNCSAWNLPLESGISIFVFLFLPTLSPRWTGFSFLNSTKDSYKFLPLVFSTDFLKYSTRHPLYNLS